jgi:hypothetical protein
MFSYVHFLEEKKPRLLHLGTYLLSVKTFRHLLRPAPSLISLELVQQQL